MSIDNPEEQLGKDYVLDEETAHIGALAENPYRKESISEDKIGRPNNARVARETAIKVGEEAMREYQRTPEEKLAGEEKLMANRITDVEKARAGAIAEDPFRKMAIESEKAGDLQTSVDMYNNWAEIAGEQAMKIYEKDNNPIEDIKTFSLIDPDGWRKTVETNTGSGKFLVYFAAEWANLMEAKMTKGAKLEDIVSSTLDEVDKKHGNRLSNNAITIIVRGLSDMWIHGKELLDLYKKKSGII